MLSFFKPGGNDCVSFSAFSESVTTSVYRCFEHRILNLVCAERLRILTSLASARLAFCKKSRISVICFGMVYGNCNQTESNGKIGEHASSAKIEHKECFY
jgi:hypothetical protein